MIVIYSLFSVLVLNVRVQMGPCWQHAWWYLVYCYASYDVSIKICKIWDAAQKYEKLDVGSFAAVKCNDAFAAGPGDISKYFCKKHTWVLQILCACIIFNLSSHTCQFARSIFTWRRSCWQGGMPMFVLAAKNVMKSGNFSRAFLPRIKHL